MARVDLHVHSTASDGHCAPADVVHRARAAGLAAIALTDHDTTAGLAEAAAAGVAAGVVVVRGCEFSAAAPWGELHLLAYFLPAEPRVEAFLAVQRGRRAERMAVIVERLAALGLAVRMEDVLAAAAGGAIGRPHAARALVAAGAARTVQDAFHRYLGRGKPAFVPKDLPPVAEVTALVAGARGVTAAAHLGEHGTDAHARWLRDQGVSALEVLHPAHDDATAARLRQLADRLGMAVSGGSDWHGEAPAGGRRAPLGGLDVPAAWLERLDRARPAGAEEHDR